MNEAMSSIQKTTRNAGYLFLPRSSHYDVVHIRTGKLRLIICTAAILVRNTVGNNRRARGRKRVDH